MIDDVLRIGLVDSGIDADTNRLSGFVSKGVDLTTDADNHNSYKDENGHGTACADLITRGLQPGEVSLFVYKVASQEISISHDLIKRAIRLAILDNIHILNCSFGSIAPHARHDLEGVVSEAVSAGMVLICAWNDDGYTTWPASFESVVSVKAGQQKSQTEWGWQEGKKNHVIFRGTKQRVRWSNNREVFMGGSSLATSLCTNVVAKQVLNESVICDVSSVLSFLEKQASYHLDYDPKQNTIIPWNNFHCKIGMAGLYPYSKEMEPFMRFRGNQPYKVGWIADTRLGRAGGKYLDEMIDESDERLLVHARLPSDTQGIDTLVVGYLDAASDAQKRDLLGEALGYAERHNLNAFTFLPPRNHDDWRTRFEERGCWLEFPLLHHDTVRRVIDEIHEQKAFDTPIVGIFGTSPKIGKFSLQLAIRYELQKRGYRVGQIGTEHHSGCFGIELTFPSGYGAAKSLLTTMECHIPYLRRVLSEMDKGQFDIILVGAQSGLLHPDIYYYGNVVSELFLMATLPDKCIVVSRKTDDPVLQERIDLFVQAKTGQKSFRTVWFEDIVADGATTCAAKIVDDLVSCSPSTDFR